MSKTESLAFLRLLLNLFFYHWECKNVSLFTHFDDTIDNGTEYFLNYERVNKQTITCAEPHECISFYNSLQLSYIPSHLLATAPPSGHSDLCP